MLQAVVAHQHVDLAMRFEQRARSGRAIGADEDGHAGAARDQHRLVAEVLGCRDVGIDARNAERIGLAARHAAVTARDHARIPSTRLQRLEDREHDRRLPRPADAHVADDDHGHARFPLRQDAGAIQEPADRDRGSEHDRERQQDERAAAQLLPLALETLAHRRWLSAASAS